MRFVINQTSLQIQKMSLRAIQQFVVHVESFRNIDLWYQGAYILKLQIYMQKDVGQKQKQKIYAFPFAHTQQYLTNEELQQVGDTQVIKQAFTQNQTSSFMTKSILLKYYEEEVELNDIVHFRIETDISIEDQQFILEANLLFFDQQIKKVDPDEITPQKGKNPKTKRYFLKNSRNGIHQYIPLSFDGQYFCIANLTLHSICLDYRYRICNLQLFEFSKMSQAEKKKLLQRNKKIQSKETNYLQSVLKPLHLPQNISSLQVIEDIVIKNMKKYYQILLKEYRHLFKRAITEAHKQAYHNLLIHPNQLGLYQDQSTFWKNQSTQERLFKKYKSKNPNEIIQNMLNETNLISGQLLKLWHRYIDLIKISPRFTIAHYQDIHTKQLQSFWSKLRIISQTNIKDICIVSSEIDYQHTKLQKQLLSERSNITFESNIISQQLYNKKPNLCFMIEDIYKNSEKQHDRKSAILQKQSNDISLHLVVLVHGFQGNSLDMKLIKNNLSLVYPQVSFLCASSNQEMTDTDIVEMGCRLANEIKNYITEFFPPGSLEHLSFIGHSLGGVIIRAALPRLLDFKDKFHTFITFSSPHLGYKVNASSVIQAGIWVLQKFKNSNCLKQLTMADNPNPKETCLFKISKFEGLKYFKNLFLFSSKQDSYAPFQSARIQIHPDFMSAKDPLKEIHCEMVKNILKDIEAQKLHRIGVNFTIQETNLDSIIGRTAHILFLQNSELIQLFLHTHPQLFD